jgi:hypothetical protein
MLSSVSKLADKAFVMGFLLPALLAVFTAVNVFHCPPWFHELCTPSEKNPFADLTYIALVVWFLAVLLLAVNYWAYRLLEGYLPPLSWLAPLRDWHKRRFTDLTAERARLRELGIMREASRIKTFLINRYPSRVEQVLPTAFGNAIRAFEMYPSDIYGADSISLWPRLGSVIPSSFQAIVNDARAQVDFFVNVCCLSLLLGAAAVIKLVAEWGGTRFAAWPEDGTQLATTAIVASAISAAAYVWSIGRVTDWGNLVKTSFDCYLPALAKQLGYVLPSSEADREQFWRDVGQLTLYHQKMQSGKWELANDSVAVKSAPRSAGFNADSEDRVKGDGDDDG